MTTITITLPCRRCGSACDVQALTPERRCPRCEQKREYHRRYAARRRAARLAEQLRTATRCPVRMGRFGACNTLLRIETDGEGRTRVVCDGCERRKRGICRDCPRRVDGTVGRALRCATCRRLAGQAAERRSYVKHRPRILRQERARYRKDPAERRRRNDYKRLWRQSNPERVRRSKRKKSEAARAHEREYHRQYRERKRAERAGVERARYHGALPPRTCVGGCGTVLTGRAKKCDACRQRAKRDARAAIAARLAQLDHQEAAA